MKRLAVSLAVALVSLSLWSDNGSCRHVQRIRLRWVELEAPSRLSRQLHIRMLPHLDISAAAAGRDALMNVHGGAKQHRTEPKRQLDDLLPRQA